MPLTPLPLASQSYVLDSLPASAQRLLNMYAEKLPEGSRSPFLLKPTAGLASAATIGTGPVWASATLGGSYFAVSGSHLWRLLDNLGIISTALDLGSVGTVSSSFYHVTIAVGLTGVVVCVPPKAYVTDFAGTAVVEITAGTGNFPAEGASSVCYVGGYYVFTSYTGSYFFTSAVLDATHYDSLDFVRLSSEVDFVEHCVAHNGELWLFGQNTVQAWYGSGTADFPFRPRVGSVMRHGLGAPRSVVELDGSMFWLGVDNVVYRSQGYQAMRVSNHALEAVLEDYDGGYLRTISACGFMHEGHSYYALQLPLAGSGRTFVYDCATQVWHERCSATDGTGRWDINTASALSARVLLGDAVTGDVWHMLSSSQNEKGIVTPRVATLPVLTTHGPRAFMSRLEVEMDVGAATSPATLTIDWSDDGGITWTTPRTLGTGALGATRTRVATTRLGSFRQRVLRLTANNGAATIFGVDADIAPGNT